MQFCARLADALHADLPPSPSTLIPLSHCLAFQWSCCCFSRLAMPRTGPNSRRLAAPFLQRCVAPASPFSAFQGAVALVRRGPATKKQASGRQVSPRNQRLANEWAHTVGPLATHPHLHTLPGPSLGVGVEQRQVSCASRRDVAQMHGGRHGTEVV